MKFEVDDVVILDQRILGWVIGFINETHDPLRDRMVIKWESGNIIEYYYNTEVGKWYLERCMKVATTMDIVKCDMEKYKDIWAKLAKL